MYVPSAIFLSGHLLHGRLVMVKPLEVEKKLHIQSNAFGAVPGGIQGPFEAVDGEVSMGNLHFNMTELQLLTDF